MPVTRIAVGPVAAEFATGAVAAGGGTVVERTDAPDALVWLDHRDMDGLATVLADLPGVRWVQLPFAGVERAAALGLFDDTSRVWTCAKGAYGEPVAEHALALALAGLRHLPERARATSWGSHAGTTLYDAPVTVLGAGGITTALIELLVPFRCPVTVVRRRPDPVPGARTTVATDRLHEALAGARVVVLALALTAETERIIDAGALAAMDGEAWLVNVARGAHVDTDALVAALGAGAIGGAALDVTDPEPLPDGHPLWTAPRCLITPHTANTFDSLVPRLAERITDNVGRFRSGEPLVGVVDLVAGY